jgi:hypothetical protein
MRRVAVLLALLVIPGVLQAQAIRGRVFDQARTPLQGALVEIRDGNGKSLQIVLTSPTGAFQSTVPAAGRYWYRAAAIGYQPRPWSAVAVPDAGVILADILLAPTAMRLPDLVALARGRYCGKSGPVDAIYERMLESARLAFQVIDATIQSRQVKFEVARIRRMTRYGGYLNDEVADTTLELLSQWPIQSIDPDTLRLVGFGRTRESGDESTREYFGPDVRVLFSDWFLRAHCFTVDKPRRKGEPDTLHLRFAPVRKTKLVDIAGELVLDAHDLSLLQFSFVLTNLPTWMPEDAAGGEMQFAKLPSGLWMTRTWAIWAPVTGYRVGSRGLTVGGQQERYGWVNRVFTATDTISVIPAKPGPASP